MVSMRGADRLSNRCRMQSDKDPYHPDMPGTPPSARSGARGGESGATGDSAEEDWSAVGSDRESDPIDDFDDDLDEQFPLGDGVVETAAEIWCPYCGEPSEVMVDPGGGSLQQYVEDCPVCCRPWQVTVHFAFDGSVTVACDADDASMDDLD